MSAKDKSDNPKRASALKYSGSGAPRITARGEGDVAAQIEAVAIEHNVPILQDLELSAALSTLPLGQEIPENLYFAVANVLAHIYDLNDRVPEGVRREKDVTPPGA